MDKADDFLANELERAMNERELAGQSMAQSMANVVAGGAGVPVGGERPAAEPGKHDHRNR